MVLGLCVCSHTSVCGICSWFPTQVSVSAILSYRYRMLRTCISDRMYLGTRNGRRFGRVRFGKREHEGWWLKGNAFMSLAQMIVLVVFGLSFGCGGPFHDFDEFDNEDMQWQEFMAQYGHELDLTDASSIAIGGRYSIDSHDVWYKVAASESTYETLWERRDRRLANDGYEYCDRSGAPIRRAQQTGWSSMEGWVVPEIQEPPWWNIKPSSRLECTAWEVRCNRTTELAGGENWAYDRANAVIWIWRWRRQCL